MKSWYLSKTVWINILGLLVEVAQVALDLRWLPAGTITGILAVLNILLRFVSKAELSK